MTQKQNMSTSIFCNTNIKFLSALKINIFYEAIVINFLALNGIKKLTYIV